MLQCGWFPRSHAAVDIAERLTMGHIGLPEMIIILAIIIVVFGANRLPELGRGIGRAIRNFRDASKEDPNPRG
jgi:sec-independent protein translocase protein TatA